MMRLLKNISLLAVFSVFLAMAGCATILSGSTQTIAVQALNANTQERLSDVRCTITDGQGNVYTLSDVPGTVMVTKGKGALNFDCRKKGYRQTNVGAGESFNAWTVANVLFWPGFLVDAATGALQKYPSHFTVLMSPIGK